MLVMTALLAGLLAGPSTALAWRLEPTYSAIATEIAQRPVAVYCAEGTEWPFGTALGVTNIEPGNIWLPTTTCDRLAAFTNLTLCAGPLVSSCDPTSLAQGIHALSHEAWHAAGILDEALTDCRSLSTFGLVAQRLGAPPVTAMMLEFDERLHYHMTKHAVYYQRGCAS